MSNKYLELMKLLCPELQDDELSAWWQVKKFTADPIEQINFKDQRCISALHNIGLKSCFNYQEIRFFFTF